MEYRVSKLERGHIDLNVRLDRMERKQEEYVGNQERRIDERLDKRFKEIEDKRFRKKADRNELILMAMGSIIGGLGGGIVIGKLLALAIAHFK